MTTATKQRTVAWWRLLLAAIAAALAGLLGAGTASATTVSVAETRVGASPVASQVIVGVADHIAAGQRWGNAPPRAESTAGFCVAANGGRTVAMGRNMADRVIPYAQRNGYDWYKGTPGWVPRGAIEKVSPRALERTDLWFNKRWIKGEMRSGSRIMDIGEPPGYPPSIFYNMERQQVSGYRNYFQDFQP